MDLTIYLNNTTREQFFDWLEKHARPMTFPFWDNPKDPYGVLARAENELLIYVTPPKIADNGREAEIAGYHIEQYQENGVMGYRPLKEYAPFKVVTFGTLLVGGRLEVTIDWRKEWQMLYRYYRLLFGDIVKAWPETIEALNNHVYPVGGNMDVVYFDFLSVPVVRHKVESFLEDQGKTKAFSYRVSNDRDGYSITLLEKQPATAEGGHELQAVGMIQVFCDFTDRTRLTCWSFTDADREILTGLLAWLSADEKKPIMAGLTKAREKQGEQPAGDGQERAAHMNAQQDGGKRELYGDQLVLGARGRWHGNFDALDASLKTFSRRHEQEQYEPYAFRFTVLDNQAYREPGQAWMIGQHDYNRTTLMTVEVEPGLFAPEGGWPYAEIIAREAAGFLKVELWHNGRHHQSLFPYLLKLWAALEDDGLESVKGLEGIRLEGIFGEDFLNWVAGLPPHGSEQGATTLTGQATGVSAGLRAALQDGYYNDAPPPGKEKLVKVLPYPGELDHAATFIRRLIETENLDSWETSSGVVLSVLDTFPYSSDIRARRWHIEPQLVNNPDAWATLVVFEESPKETSLFFFDGYNAISEPHDRPRIGPVLLELVEFIEARILEGRINALGLEVDNRLAGQGQDPAGDLRRKQPAETRAVLPGANESGRDWAGRDLLKDITIRDVQDSAISLTGDNIVNKLIIQSALLLLSPDRPLTLGELPAGDVQGEQVADGELLDTAGADATGQKQDPAMQNDLMPEQLERERVALVALAHDREKLARKAIDALRQILHR